MFIRSGRLQDIVFKMHLDSATCVWTLIGKIHFMINAAPSKIWEDLFFTRLYKDINMCEFVWSCDKCPAVHLPVPSLIHVYDHLVRTKLTWRRGSSGNVRPSMLTRCWKLSSLYRKMSFPLASTLKGADFQENHIRQVNFDRTWTTWMLRRSANQRSS